MNMKRAMFILVWFIGAFAIMAQETLDASDPSNFVVGGAQGFHFLSMNLLEVQIIDVEPEIDNAITFGVDPNSLEAGLPVLSGTGGTVNEDLWLNITSRTSGVERYNALVYSNQPVPSGFTIKVQVLNTTSVGGLGNSGTATGAEITISETPTIVISDVGSGYTTDGINKGFQLRYIISNSGGGSLPVGFEILYDLQLQN